ncbi:MAG: hypothetical protein ACP5N1_05630 [Candidatus Woesearchaeota archaeon]
MNKLSFDDILKTRDKALIYGSTLERNGYAKKGYDHCDLDELLCFLKKDAGIELDVNSFSDIIFSDMHKYHYSESIKKFKFEEDHYMVDNIFYWIESENTSIDRLGKIFGKPIYDMNTEELINASMRLFTEIYIPPKKFLKDNSKSNIPVNYSLVLEKNIEDQLKKEYGEFYTDYMLTDKYILPGVLNIRGIKFGKEEILKKLLEIEYPEFGVNEPFFKDQLVYFSSFLYTGGPSLSDLHKSFYDTYEKFARRGENLPEIYLKMKDSPLAKLLIPKFYQKIIFDSE